MTTLEGTYLGELAEDIEMIGERREVLELMIALGKELEELPLPERSAENLVPGCVSNVHVVTELLPDGGLHFRGSSQAFIVRGYVKALFDQFEGWRPEQFLNEAEPLVEQFLARTGLAESVIATRANSIGNILATMKKQTAALAGR